MRDSRDELKEDEGRYILGDAGMMQLMEME